MSAVEHAIAWLRRESTPRVVEHVVVAGLTVHIIHKVYRTGVRRTAKNIVSFLISSVPGVRGSIEAKVEEEVKASVKEMFSAVDVDGLPARAVIPATGMSAEDILAVMSRAHHALDMRPETGECFAYVYHLSDEHDELMSRVWSIFGKLNALNPSAFQSLRKFEVDVIAMSANLMHGDDTVCGAMTSGGTESILCAIKAYREWAKVHRPDALHPEIVAPITVHPAFDKACHYFGIRLVHVPIDPVTMKPLQKDVRSAITRNTILLVCSAPQYPHGVVDPVSEFAQLADEFQLPLHVDACVGGFVLPWLEELGYEVPTWDFRIPQVTSITADLHKFGFVPKGASVVLYRNDSLRRHQYFAVGSWPGGLFVSPGIIGTRSGGPIACAWATLHELGHKGYCDAFKLLMETSQYLQKEINNTEHLRVYGKPDLNLVSFGSDTINVLAVADVMDKEYGWKLERQQLPPAVHMTVMIPHAQRKEQLITDLRKAVAAVVERPSLASQGSAAMYGMVAKIPDDTIVDGFLTSFMANVYK